MATSAGYRVAHITELLEQILAHLDSEKIPEMKTLLLSQRVSRAFRDTIGGSSTLQENLHFRPPQSEYEPEPHEGVNWPLFRATINQRMPDGRSAQFLWHVMIHEDSPSCTEISVHLKAEAPPSAVLDTTNENQASWRRMYLHRKHYRVTIGNYHHGASLRHREAELINPTAGEVVNVFFSKRPTST